MGYRAISPDTLFQGTRTLCFSVVAGATIRSDAAGTAQAQRDRDFDKKFNRYLLGNGELMFGDMIAVIERSQRSVVPTDLAFARHIPEFSETVLRQMKQVRDLRGGGCAWIWAIRLAVDAKSGFSLPRHPRCHSLSCS
jgi:hypothetical protein